MAMIEIAKVEQTRNELHNESNGNHLRSRMKKVIEIDCDVALNFTVHSAEGIDHPSLYPWENDRIYAVVFSIEPGTEYHTDLELGSLDPVWRQQFRIELNDSLDNYPFINVEVIRLRSKSDPGPSNGIVVVGRAKIPLPKVESIRKEGRYGLVRFGEKGCKAEGHITVSMEFEKIYCLD